MWGDVNGGNDLALLTRAKPGPKLELPPKGPQLRLLPGGSFSPAWRDSSILPVEVKGAAQRAQRSAESGTAGKKEFRARVWPKREERGKRQRTL